MDGNTTLMVAEAFVAKRKAHDMDVFIRDSKARMSRMMDDDVHSFPTVPDQLALTLAGHKISLLLAETCCEVGGQSSVTFYEVT